ncbi:MAG: hypothetical protein ACSHW1_11390 [Yoonia sp.]|uniref:hypothetical protein n=1 Tax=Yoonia sp. TaxID=2212373 RepID=UPI003EF8C6B1
MKSFRTGIAVGILAAVVAGGVAYAQGMHRHGAMAHNEVTMPGLRGENATPEESAELALMFRNFDTITREVENLPNGIRTVTRSSNPAVMDALVSHSVGMIDRVGAKDDPKIFIQSPTLDAFFLHGDKISSVVEVTDDGLVVVQTSDDPVLVEALQVHAAEVTDMADRGMAAVHEMMMQQGRGH